MPTHEFPYWHVIAQSTGKRLGDPHQTYSDAESAADFAFMRLTRTERFQVFYDDGSGKFTLMYDATEGRPVGISPSDMQEVEGRVS